MANPNIGQHAAAGGKAKAAKRHALTVDFLTDLRKAYQELGGIEGLVTFGKKNPVEFYKIMAKTLPKDMNVSVSMLEPMVVVLANDAD
ncbi:MAG: hypothetical protein WCP20_11055 [Desulfuromonadales bacterium]